MILYMRGAMAKDEHHGPARCRRAMGALPDSTTRVGGMRKRSVAVKGKECNTGMLILWGVVKVERNPSGHARACVRCSAGQSVGEWTITNIGAIQSRIEGEAAHDTRATPPLASSHVSLNCGGKREKLCAGRCRVAACVSKSKIGRVETTSFPTRNITSTTLYIILKSWLVDCMFLFNEIVVLKGAFTLSGPSVVKPH
jgi:hypothetical protein